MPESVSNATCAESGDFKTIGLFRTNDSTTLLDSKLSGMSNDIGVDIIGNHLDDGEGCTFDLVSLKSWEGPQKLIWAVWFG